MVVSPVWRSCLGWSEVGERVWKVVLVHLEGKYLMLVPNKPKPFTKL